MDPTQSWTPRSRFVKSVKSNRLASFGRKRVADVSIRVFNRSCQRRSVRRHRGVAAGTWSVESSFSYVDQTFVCAPFERVRPLVNKFLVLGLNADVFVQVSVKGPEYDCSATDCGPKRAVGYSYETTFS